MQTTCSMVRNDGAPGEQLECADCHPSRSKPSPPPHSAAERLHALGTSLEWATSPGWVKNSDSGPFGPILRLFTSGLVVNRAIKDGGKDAKEDKHQPPQRRSVEIVCAYSHRHCSLQLFPREREREREREKSERERERERIGTGILFKEPNPTGSRPSDLIGLGKPTDIDDNEIGRNPFLCLKSHDGDGASPNLLLAKPSSFHA